MNLSKVFRKAKLIIPVEYKGEQLVFRGRLLQGKYGYNFKVEVDGGEILFEEDKDGRYWMKVVGSDLEGVDGELVEAIRGVVEEAGR